MNFEEMLANNSKMLGEILGTIKKLQDLQQRGFEGHLRLVETVERITLEQDGRMTRLEGVVERLAKLVEAFVRASGNGQTSPQQ